MPAWSGMGSGYFRGSSARLETWGTCRNNFYAAPVSGCGLYFIIAEDKGSAVYLRLRYHAMCQTQQNKVTGGPEPGKPLRLVKEANHGNIRPWCQWPLAEEATRWVMDTKHQGKCYLNCIRLGRFHGRPLRESKSKVAAGQRAPPGTGNLG